MNNRQSIRLPDHDYSKGIYFVTVDVQDKLALFWNDLGKGRPRGSPVPLISGVGAAFMAAQKINGAGLMVEECWLDLKNRFDIRLDKYVVMADHFHGIIKLNNQNNYNLGEIIGAFKSISTGKYIAGIKNLNWPKFHGCLWQRNYYEEIIRSEDQLNQIRKYILENPKKWEK